MAPTPFRVIQISDIHLSATSESELLGVNTEESFKAIIKSLQANETNLDMILLTGDLSQDGSLRSYQRLITLLQPFAVPIYCLPGNHDDVAVMTHVFSSAPISMQKQIIVNNWQLILLNSQKPNAVEGYLNHDELSFMEDCLRQYPNHAAIVLFHHQPLPVGSEWLDNLGLSNAETFWRILSHYPQAQTIVFGHVHQEHEAIFQGVHCYSAPSTCIQFKRQADQFGLEKLPPGYRWLNLFPNGQLETGIIRLEDYVGIFDINAKGY